MMQEAALYDHAGPEGSFCHRAALLLAKIDCRLATSGEEREAIFRLRFDAGFRERAISQRSSVTFSDRYDDAGNVYLFGLYIDNELASSIRLHITSREQHQCPSGEMFADLLQSKLQSGQVIIDCTRFVADEHFSQLNRELPYATLRLCVLAAEYFNADYLITVANQPHQAFYRRAFNYKPVSEQRFHPDLAAPVRLMTLNYPTAAHDLYSKYPFFRSTPAERRNLFEHNNVLPAPPKRQCSDA
jgi:N-acyl-L-homoserine lactone synthetase